MAWTEIHVDGKRGAEKDAWEDSMQLLVQDGVGRRAIIAVRRAASGAEIILSDHVYYERPGVWLIC